MSIHTWVHTSCGCERLLWKRCEGGTGALVGGYSQYLYGAINQWGDATLNPRGKRGADTGSKQIEDIVGGWGGVLYVSLKHYIIT